MADTLLLQVLFVKLRKKREKNRKETPKLVKYTYKLTPKLFSV